MEGDLALKAPMAIAMVCLFKEWIFVFHWNC